MRVGEKERMREKEGRTVRKRERERLSGGRKSEKETARERERERGVKKSEKEREQDRKGQGANRQLTDGQREEQ